MSGVLAPPPIAARTDDDPVDNRIGPRPGSGRRTIVVLAAASVALLIVSMVTILVAGLAFWRSSEPVPASPAAKSYSGTLPTPVRIAPVVKATAGACTDGGTPGRFADAGCFELGDGGMVVTVVERVNTALRDGRWLVQLRLSSDDTVALRALTTTNKRIALVLDGAVLAAPAVTQPITGGEVQIVGEFTKKDVDTIFAELTAR